MISASSTDGTVPSAAPVPPLELRVSLCLGPNPDGIGFGWRASVALGDGDPLQFASLEDLAGQLGRLARSGPPPRGIR